MTTVTIQIGNTDNKLTQNEWAHYCEYVRGAISENVYRIHFEGGSDWDAPWQNACWVCEVSDDQFAPLKMELNRWRVAFRQNSIAFTEGKTVMLGADVACGEDSADGDDSVRKS